MNHVVVIQRRGCIIDICVGVIVSIVSDHPGHASNL